MQKVTLTDADIAQLEDERERADRAYNDALTGVDQALAKPPSLPAPPPPPDDHQIGRLNAGWEIVSASPLPAGGWKGRLAAFVWRVVGPMLQRQQEFNAALVEHVNRTHARATEGREALAALADAVARELAALAHFESRLIVYLQQITLYVDTKDRHESAVLRRLVEHRSAGLAAGLDGLGDELLKRWESAVARERRFDARVEELRSRLAGYQRVSEALQAELGRIARTGAAGATTAHVGPAEERHDRKAAVTAAPEETRREALAEEAQSAVYAGFEDRFRGSPETIAARQSDYLPLFAGARDVLDIGCGRGEFLERLAANGVTARGVDLNGEMVRRCRERGLDAVEADALEYLGALPDASLGGIFAAQVVEHLPPDRLLQLLALAHRKLRPGARVVLETINPACWYAFFSSYILDITHVRPVHPETLRYLLTASGFADVDIRYTSPYPKDYKLQLAPRAVLADAPYLADLVDAFNGNVEKVNELLFTYLDYAAVGEKA